MLCKGRGFCGAMGNDASWVTVVDVCRGSLVRARVWARGRSKVILLHMYLSVPSTGSQRAGYVLAVFGPV